MLPGRDFVPLSDSGFTIRLQSAKLQNCAPDSPRKNPTGGLSMGWLKWLFNEPRYQFGFEQAKRRCRVLLIDDDANALPLVELEQDGYNVTQHKNVDSALLQRCEDGAWDIILLDYNGVAPAAITPEDGFGVFERIRNSNPQQYIVAISGQTYDISKTHYFKKANDWLKKPTDLASTKDSIDRGIRFLFDKTEVLQRLKAQLLAERINPKLVDRALQHLGNSNFTDIEEATASVRKTAKVAEISADVLATLKILIKLAP